jgi:hypothetical protein
VRNVLRLQRYSTYYGLTLIGQRKIRRNSVHTYGLW